MKKLIELLNEYEKSSYEKDTNWVYEGKKWEYYEPNNRIIKGNWENKNILTRFELCSKQFGFIKWLVENNKINFVKVKDNDDWYYIDLNDKYLEMLALLSISDTPIELLVSILK